MKPTFIALLALGLGLPLMGADKEKTDVEKADYKGRVKSLKVSWFDIEEKEGFVGAGKWVHVRPRDLNKYGITRNRKDRQINSLEEAGLIDVKRGVGRCHSVRALRA